MNLDTSPIILMQKVLTIVNLYREVFGLFILSLIIMTVDLPNLNSMAQQALPVGEREKSIT